MDDGVSFASSLPRPAASTRLPFVNRTPLQAFLLNLTTGGLYGLYWVIRARRLEERRLERPLRPYWHWLGLVVPFLNLFLLIDGYNLICSGVRRAGVVPPVPFGVSGAFMLLMGVLWKLPGAWWLLSFFSAVVFAAMHVSLDHAERMRGLDPRLARLTAWEIVIVVLGGSLLVLGVLGTCLDEPLRTWIAVGTGVLVILAFGVVFFRIGARRYAGDGRSVRD